MLKSLMGALLLGAIASATQAVSQEFPTRTVTIIGAAPAGSAPDVLARAVGDRLSRKWKQPVVVEARPGAAYAIAAVAMARAAPDGYTLVASELGMFTYQHLLYKPGERKFDGEKDFAPVSGMAEVPVAVIASRTLPVANMSELIELARKKPGSITVATGGPGTLPHMSALMLERMAGVKFLMVHYKGVTPALNDVTAGHVNMVMMGPSIAISSYKAGKLNILGVGGDEPLPQLPEVPPISRTVPGFSVTAGFGIAAPAGTPRAILDRINRDVQAVLDEPEFKEKVLVPQSLSPMRGDVDAFTARLRAQSTIWGRIITESGFRL